MSKIFLRKSLGQVLTVSLFSTGGLIVGVATQLAMAALFGARREMDAYLVATTLPQFITALLIASLNYVFIPVFVEYQQTGDIEMAWRIASTLLNLSSIALVLISVVGIALASPLLKMSVPGFDTATLSLAVTLARLTWPTILTTGLCTLIIGIYQSHQRFGWSAAAPVVGALVTLLMLFVLMPTHGISGLAIATLIGSTAQLILLIPFLFHAGRYRLELSLRLPGVRRVLGLMVGLVVIALFSRGSILIERFVLSWLPPGNIAHLAYANKLITILTAILSTGLAVTSFVTMSERTAERDLAGLRHVISTRMRLMWLFVAPAAVILTVLRQPLIGTLFERGEFGTADTGSVAAVLPFYLIALVPMTLGTIIANSLYALKQVRAVAVVSMIVTIAYAAVLAWLARHLGIKGVALGFTFYWFLPFAIMGGIMWDKTGREFDQQFWRSMVVTLIASCAGGAGAKLGMIIFGGSNFWRLTAGLIVGGTLYLFALALLRSDDLWSITELVRKFTRIRLFGDLKSSV